MKLEYDLREEQVKHLDLSWFATVKSGTPVKEAIEQMRRANQNCALIMRDETLLGIFTDRDMLMKVVTAPNTWNTAIDTVMTTTPITVKDTDYAEDALHLMNEKRVRNLPVINDAGRVAGNLTHYALIKFFADQFPESVYNLPPDPNRTAHNRVGG